MSRHKVKTKLPKYAAKYKYEGVWYVPAADILLLDIQFHDEQFEATAQMKRGGYYLDAQLHIKTARSFQECIDLGWVKTKEEMRRER